MSTVRASAYLVVKADVRSGTVRSAKIANLRQTRPFLEWDEIAVKIHLDLPSSIFDRNSSIAGPVPYPCPTIRALEGPNRV